MEEGQRMSTMEPSDARGAARALRDLLVDAGARAEVIEAAGGSAIVVLTHGARVIGVFSPGLRGNLVWNSERLRDSASCRELLRSAEWCNTGGDRTWIAPELDFFYPDYPRTDRYLQPRSLDPGAWSSERGGNAVTLRSEPTLRCFRTGEDVRLRITKRIRPLGGLALRAGVPLPLLGLASCGYSVSCRLDILGETPRAAVGLWDLLQLPPGGRMLIGTRGTGRAVRYFGDIPADALAESDGLVRWTMAAPGEQKIGVAPDQAVGRVCHLREDGGRAVLAVRDFTVDPAGLYPDAPWGAARGPGCAIQACNVNSGLGRFNELEYHAPAIGGGTGLGSVSDTSRARFFHGDAGRVRALAARLLAVPAIP
jgi:hypothetical protein